MKVSLLSILRSTQLLIHGLPMLCVLLLCITKPLSAQEYHGTSGLLHTPSAEMRPVGTFSGGAAFLDSEVMPHMVGWNRNRPFNAPAYTLGVTLFSWLEMSYTGVLGKIRQDDGTYKYTNEDRHFNVKARLLKEGKWWPAIALGIDDFGHDFSFGIKDDKSWTGNNNFECHYAVASKHVSFNWLTLGAHLAFRTYPEKHNGDRKGWAGGITLAPTALPHSRLIAEWDGKGVNVGGDILLWRHLFLQAALVHGKGLMAVAAYQYTIPF